MKASTRSGMMGKLHLVKAKMKKTAGQMFKDSKLEVEGRAEQLAGKVRITVGRVKKALGR